LIEKVWLSQELKRKIVIQQLLDLGIREHRGQSIYDLDYYTLKHILATQRAVQS